MGIGDGGDGENMSSAGREQRHLFMLKSKNKKPLRQYTLTIQFRLRNICDFFINVLKKAVYTMYTSGKECTYFLT